jgi:hypothetical protein
MTKTGSLLSFSALLWAMPAFAQPPAAAERVEPLRFDRAAVTVDASAVHERGPLVDLPRSGAASLTGAAQPRPVVEPMLSLEELTPRRAFDGSAYGGSLGRAISSRMETIHMGGAGVGPFLNGSGACTYDVSNHGGRIMGQPKIHRFFWGDYWTQAAHTAEATGYDNTWTTLANSPSFYTRLSEYGVSPGSAGARYNIAGAATGSVTDAMVTSQIQSYIRTTSYSPNGNDLFVVFLPSGTTNDTNINNGWSGHHNHFSAQIRVGIFSFNVDVAYAIIEYSSDPNYTNPVVSHEASEAASDPDLNAWYDSGGAEIGDICRFAYNNIGGKQVETTYSQKSCRCVRERDLDTLDYAGTGKPTLTVFRHGTWYGDGAASYWNFGQAGDVPLPGDFNGDGKTEYALFRGASSNWFILNTASGLYDTYSFGIAGDIPVPADYDGDGKTDIAVWRPSNGTWYIINSSTGAWTVTQWGTSGDIPVPADFDNDGKADPAVRRPSNSTWYVLPSTTPGSYTWSAWGVSTDVPVPGDFNGDGKCDWALFRPSEGRFYISPKDGTSAYWVGWGTWGDIPVVRDYDGDWKADIAVWRPSDGNWYVINSSGGNTTTQWGTNGDIPVERGVR